MNTLEEKITRKCNCTFKCTEHLFISMTLLMNSILISFHLVSMWNISFQKLRIYVYIRLWKIYCFKYIYTKKIFAPCLFIL